MSPAQMKRDGPRAKAAIREAERIAYRLKQSIGDAVSARAYSNRGIGESEIESDIEAKIDKGIIPTGLTVREIIEFGDRIDSHNY